MSQNVIAKQTKIGASINFTPDMLECNEDLVIDGNVSVSRIDVGQNTLVIGKTSTVEADLHGGVIEVIGNVTGSLTATMSITVAPGAMVNGDLYAPKFFISSEGKCMGRLNYQ